MKLSAGTKGNKISLFLSKSFSFVNLNAKYDAIYDFCAFTRFKGQQGLNFQRN